MSLTLTMSDPTGAFYLYAEPNPFSFFDITVTADDGTSLTTDFAIGEFGIAAAEVPEPTTLALVAFALLGNRCKSLP